MIKRRLLQLGNSIENTKPLLHFRQMCSARRQHTSQCRNNQLSSNYQIINYLLINFAELPVGPGMSINLIFQLFLIIDTEK